MSFKVFLIVSILLSFSNYSFGETKMVKNSSSEEVHEMYISKLTFLNKSGPNKEVMSKDDLIKFLKVKGFEESDFKIINSRSGPYQKELVLHSTKLQVVRWVNNIRIYFNSLIPNSYLSTYLVSDKGERILCVTLEWQKLFPNWRYDQSEVKIHDFSKLNQKLLEECKINQSELLKEENSKLYKDLRRDQIKEKFFTKNGVLKRDQFPQLHHNLYFIHHLLELGFYLIVGDETGTLEIL